MIAHMTIVDVHHADIALLVDKAAVDVTSVVDLHCGSSLCNCNHDCDCKFGDCKCRKL